MSIKNVLCLGAVALVSFQAIAKDAKSAITPGQKSALTQLCLEGKISKNNTYQTLNSVLGANIHGDGGMSAPQGDLVVSNGKGKYAFVEMVSGSYFGHEDAKKGEDLNLKRSASTSRVLYIATTVDQGVVSKFEVSVFDFATGMVNGDATQYCRIGQVVNTAIKDETAASILNINEHRQIFSQTKTQGAAQTALVNFVKTGKIKLTDEEILLLKELLFGEYHSTTAVAQTAKTVLDFAIEARTAQERTKEENDTAKADEVSEQTEYQQKVVARGKEVKAMNYNFTAMNKAAIRVGLEVIGKKEMFNGENDLVGEVQGETKYRPSGAKMLPFLRLVRDNRALDLIIIK